MDMGQAPIQTGMSARIPTLPADGRSDNPSTARLIHPKRKIGKHDRELFLRSLEAYHSKLSKRTREAYVRAQNEARGKALSR
jgi:hypothetical protein